MTREEIKASLLMAVSASGHEFANEDWWDRIPGSADNLLWPGHYDWCFNPVFLLEQDILTWGDAINFLNKYNLRINVGHSWETLVSSGTDGKIVLNNYTPDYGVALDTPFITVSIEDTSIAASEVSKKLGIKETTTLQYKNVRAHRGGCTIYLKNVTQANIPSRAPEWLTRVNGYNWTPPERSLKFLGGNTKTKLFFGLELEVSSQLTPFHLWHIVTQIEPKQDPFFYVKHDGSVCGKYQNKYEIVTLPCTPRFLRKSFRTFFKKLESILGPDLGTYFDLSDVSSNGLHIHVSKASFTDGKFPSRLWKNKFASIWNQWDRQNQDFLQKLSRRVISIEDATYFAPHKQMRDRTVPFRLRNGAFCRNREDRYASARETDQTVEVRLFQSRFNLDHIIYCIELTQAIHEYSHSMPISSLGRGFVSGFTKWLIKQPGYYNIKKEVGQCV